MAKTIAEPTDQQTSGLDRVKRSDRGGSGEGGPKSLSLGGQPERLRSFLTDVRAEMRKVVSPSREEVRTTTTVVIATVFVFAGYFAAVDFVVGRGITWLITHFTGH